MVLWFDGGNVNPFLRLSSELVGRGHEVEVLAPAGLRPHFERFGATCTDSAEWMPSADELLASVAATSPDLLIVDFMATETLAGAEASGIPTVALVHTLLEANRVGDDLLPMWMSGPASSSDETRRRLGLDPATSHRDLLGFADLLLVAAPELLEPDGDRDPRAVYAGPLYVAPASPDTGTVPPGDAPLIVGCAGTAATDPELEPVLLQRMIDAIAHLGLRGIVTVPEYLDRGAVVERPGVRTTTHISHPAVLPEAAVMVTHAGLGSVCAALVAGTPMVCVPLGREQPTNAAAVERTGTGVRLTPDATVDDLAAAITAVMGRDLPPVVVDPAPAIAAIEALLDRR